MLNPHYLGSLPDALVELYSQAEQDILADMARRIRTYDYWIPAAEHQYQKMIEMGYCHESILQELSRRTGKTRTELEQLMTQAGNEALHADLSVYRKAGLVKAYTASESMNRILNAGIESTSGLFSNLTATTAQTGSQQFVNALDRAWMQIQTGGFDYNTAIRNAVKSLCKQGVGSIQYASGRTDHLEVAVRRAVVTGVNQTALKMQCQLADELGCDLVETTAHAGARPSHAEWQGKIFSRSGKHPKYPDFVKSTGYGTGPGLGGWNCRHSFYPYVEGSARAYSQEMLEEYDAKNIEYNGRKMTEYEASQKQRYIERQIRRWKRENVAMKAAGQDTAESAVKIRSWQEVQKDFVKQTGLKRQSAREQIAQYGRSEARKTTITAKAVEKRANELYNLGSTKENIAIYLERKAVHDELDAHDIKFIQWISDKEVVVDAGKPKITGMRKHAVDNLQSKSDRQKMTMERAQTFVDSCKLTVFRPEAKTLKYMSDEGYAVLNYDGQLVTAVPQKWRKKYDEYL